MESDWVFEITEKEEIHLLTKVHARSPSLYTQATDQGKRTHKAELLNIYAALLSGPCYNKMGLFKYEHLYC